MNLPPSPLANKIRLRIWLIAVSFVLFQFFLQLSSGVVIATIMVEKHLSALQAGIIGSAFYYVYTALQIPVGILFDHKDSRILLALNAFLCGVGCFVFAQSTHFGYLILGRLLMGAGSAFAFVGLSHLLRQYFPLQKFGFLIGLSETLGFLATMFATISMGSIINNWGWRNCINNAAIIGILISYLCWRYLPKITIHSLLASQPATHHLVNILKNRTAWINGLFAGLSFSTITVFGAMWVIPFLQIKLNTGMKEASFVGAFIFLGAAISCPLFGLLANRCRRKPLLISSCLITSILVLTVIYFPRPNLAAHTFFMFLIGTSCGAYMLAFSIANEFTSRESLSTCTGFTNTLAMLTAPLMQPLIGFLLDIFSQSTQPYTVRNYQYALLIIPIALITASILAYFLPEKELKTF